MSEQLDLANAALEMAMEHFTRRESAINTGVQVCLTAPLPMWCRGVGPEISFSWLNAAYEAAYGKMVQDYAFGQVAELWTRNDELVRSGGSAMTFTEPLPDGRKVEVVKWPLYSGNGEIVGIAGIVLREIAR